jgi:hypothetical protein
VKDGRSEGEQVKEGGIGDYFSQRTTKPSMTWSITGGWIFEGWKEIK